VTKVSKRWYTQRDLVKSSYVIPYIDKLGAFTGHDLATVRCSPSQYVATVTATILDRLRKRATQYNNHKVVNKHRSLLTGAAYYYSISKNSWFLDRVLALLKNLEENQRIIWKILKKFLCTLDENKRFVYSQVYFQTNWLYTRALAPRDKSIWERLHSCGEGNFSSKVEPYKLKKAIRVVSCDIARFPY